MGDLLSCMWCLPGVPSMTGADGTSTHSEQKFGCVSRGALWHSARTVIREVRSCVATAGLFPRGFFVLTGAVVRHLQAVGQSVPHASTRVGKCTGHVLFFRFSDIYFGGFPVHGQPPGAARHEALAWVKDLQERESK